MAIDIEKLTKYWNENSAEKWQVAESLKNSGHFSEVLFFCHLSLESKLKALVVRATSDHAPYIHNLARLAFLANLEPSEEQTEQLKEITNFNIAGRYKEYKEEFYHRVNKEFFDTWFSKAKQLLEWLS